MLTFKVCDHLPGRLPVAAGAELGHEHARRVATLLDAATPAGPEGCILGWDCAGLEYCTASCLKAGLVTVAGWGRWETGSLTLPEVEAMQARGYQPREVFVVVLNADAEIAEAVDAVFGRRGWPVLLTAGRTTSPSQAENSSLSEAFARAHLLGEAEATALRTLDDLRGRRQVTALELHARFSRRESVSATAWNNRLHDLYRLRLARRVRRGKTWIYSPLATDITYGQEVLTR